MGLEQMDGMFVGFLDPAELWLFEKAVEDGLARRSYEGGAGFMGLAKVRLNKTLNYPSSSERK